MCLFLFHCVLVLMLFCLFISLFFVVMRIHRLFSYLGWVLKCRKKKSLISRSERKCQSQHVVYYVRSITSQNRPRISKTQRIWQRARTNSMSMRYQHYHKCNNHLFNMPSMAFTEKYFSIFS